MSWLHNVWTHSDLIFLTRYIDQSKDFIYFLSIYVNSLQPAWLNPCRFQQISVLEMKLFETRSLGKSGLWPRLPCALAEKRDLDDHAVCQVSQEAPLSQMTAGTHRHAALSNFIFPGKEIATIFASLLLFRKAAKHLHSDSDIFNHFFRVNGYYHIDGKSLFIGGHR